MGSVSGLASFNRKVERLKEMTAAEVRLSLAQAAEIVVREQKRLAPVRSGELRDLIGYEFKAPLKVTISAKDFKARWVEFGTAPHRIEPVNAQALGPRGIYGEEVDHPGSAAHPFFFPGYRATRKQARRLIAKGVRNAIKKAVR